MALVVGVALGAAAFSVTAGAPIPRHVQVDFAGAVQPGRSVSATWRVGRATWPARWIGIEPGRRLGGVHGSVVQVASLGTEAEYANWPITHGIPLARLPIGSVVHGSVSPAGPSSWRLTMSDPAAEWSWSKTVRARRPWLHPIAVITVEGQHHCLTLALACANPPQPWRSAITFASVRVDGRLLTRPGHWLVLRRPGLSSTPHLIAPGRLVIPPAQG